MTKYNYISDLAVSAAVDITRNADAWKNYLNTAARIYKYPFNEQLLIHAQRPDASACASIEIWNNKMHCWVNRGAKGIALIDADSDYPKLKYIFDVSDVHESRMIGRKPYLWKMRKEHRDTVIGQLEKTYGETDEKLPFEERLIQLSKQIAADYMEVYAEDLSYNISDSFLEDLDELNREKRFRETLSSSIAYSLLYRCGCDVMEYADGLDFSAVSDFNTVNTVSVLGNATSEMVKPVLMEIGRTIAAYDRNLEKNRAVVEYIEREEKNLNLGLANSSEKEYSALKRESAEGEDKIPEATDTQKNLQANIKEEVHTHGDYLREERGLSGSEPRGESGTGGGTDKVWIDASELFAGAPWRNIPSVTVKGDAEITLSGNPEVGRGTDGAAGRADGGERGRDGEAQGGRPDGMGGKNEQYPQQGGGDSPERADLQLGGTPRKKEGYADKMDSQPVGTQQNTETREPGIEESAPGSFFEHPAQDEPESAETAWMETDGKFQQMSLFPLFAEQIGNIALWEAEAGVEKGSTVKSGAVVTQEQMDAILRSGGGRENSRKRIYAKYQQGKNPEEMAAFLRKEYGTTGKGFEFDGKQVSVWFDGHGMTIGHGTSALENPQIVMEWREVEKQVRALVENGSYMSASEAFLVEGAERSRIADRLYYFFSDGVGKVPEEFCTERGLYPDITEKVVDLLGTPEGIGFVAEKMDEALGQLARGEVKPRFGYVLGFKDELRAELDNLLVEKITFPAPDEVEVKKEDFITLDEIDYRLGRGSGVAHGSFRIYEYFMEGHGKEDAVKFLKNEYGIGGSSHALPGSDKSWEDHDGKGIQLKKGNIMSPYTEILLKWETVEKRIRKLISEDKYLSEKGKEEYAKYKAEQAQKELERAKEKLERETKPVETTIYPGEKNGLPYDIVVEKLRFDEPELEGQVREEIVQETPEREEPAQEEPDEPLKPVAEVTVEKAEPKIDKSNAVNFRITDDALGVGGAKEKFRRNVEAIQTLEKIESENRLATPEEQEILSKYVGWGGLADAFDESKSNWTTEYRELKNLLSPEEYASARESTLNAHYTSPVIIRNIYEVLEKMGFEKGNILEPAMGIGNFFGMLPETMRGSRLYGVELDGITGRIAKQLYPKADIKIAGFEKTDHPNDFFDVAIGNVPFGQYKVSDRQYDKHNFLIHDYFFAKALDKVRPGGVIAFVTSKGTMDKKTSEVRKYLAQRAELLGAVRLPNTAFKENAGTEVTSDILFLKKRDRIMDIEPDWVYLSEDANGIEMNSYFAQHPEMIVGKMEMVSGPFGMESTCQPDISRPFEEQLREAVSRIDGKMEMVELDELADDLINETLPADPGVKNYSYTLVDGKVYYRENSIMKPAEMTDTMLERIKGMVGIREATQEVIRLQLEDYPESAIKAAQQDLNQKYDTFTKKFGIISSQTNKRAFNQDSSYCLLCSLEKLDEEGNFQGKADMFSKRTIKKAEVVTSVDTASEALAVSLSEKARVDLDYMASLMLTHEQYMDGETYNATLEKITKELSSVIFKNPLSGRWETADEYLSGNVREKLAIARNYAEENPDFAVNVKALEEVQPKELDASEIEARLGATWIDAKYIDDFMREVFQTPEHLLARNTVGTQYTSVTGLWNIKGKNADYGNSLTSSTYGTRRINAYKILEESLNLKDVRIFDTVMEDGKEKRVLNKKETMIAAQKQDMVREAFKDWVFKEPKRRQALVEKYNILFNSTRPREYDGSHHKFPDMTPDIELKPHQKNAVAHVLYGDNTLLAHCVGAGKTFEMTAAAMESKRLGLCQKSLFVVPNHLTEQWASDFLRLYPGANILAATKKDFEPANRKKFCSRIATGDYDAVIIGHSQFEKIPLSAERQIAVIEQQIDEIETNIALAKAERGERYTIKEMEKTKKALKARMDKLYDESRKDNVVTFEQLGVDRLFVDESHNYKNLFLYTKMRNVAGIAQTEAQKSSDMLAKCQYLDELTGGRGVTFATGTPISNSMTELYTNMRYLQYGTLQRLGLGHFDSWAASFGETQTAIEVACGL